MALIPRSGLESSLKGKNPCKHRWIIPVTACYSVFFKLIPQVIRRRTTEKGLKYQPSEAMELIQHFQIYDSQSKNVQHQG